MNWQAVNFDWNQTRSFLATVEEGSFSAAARALGLTQPTLSRQITALEQSLGVTLFERGHRSMDVTEAGIELLEHVRAMGEAAARISIAASGQSLEIEGRVSLTCTSVMGAYFLPPVMEKLRERAPGIVVDIVASNDVRDLKKREADIALRHARPEQPDLIARLLRETTGGLYASPAFLDRVGRPSTPEEAAKLDFIGFDQNERALPYFHEIGLPLSLENFKISSGSGEVEIAMVEQGLGVGVLTKDVASFHPHLERVLPDLPPIMVPVWLVTHRELHTSRRIRLVFDLLAEEISSWKPG